MESDRFSTSNLIQNVKELSGCPIKVKNRCSGMEKESGNISLKDFECVESTRKKGLPSDN
jgi:hypothetical protein